MSKYDILIFILPFIILIVGLIMFNYYQMKAIELQKKAFRNAQYRIDSILEKWERNNERTNNNKTK